VNPVRWSHLRCLPSPTRRHPACRCNLAPSTSSSALVVPATRRTTIDDRAFASCMEQSSSVRHSLHNLSRLENISGPTYFDYDFTAPNSSLL